MHITLRMMSKYSKGPFSSTWFPGCLSRCPLPSCDLLIVVFLCLLLMLFVNVFHTFLFSFLCCIGRILVKIYSDLISDNTSTISQLNAELPPKQLIQPRC